LKTFLTFEYPVKNPWTNVYGLARSVLACGTMLTLLFNTAKILFPVVSQSQVPNLTESLLYRLNFFFLFRDHGEIGRFLAVFLLLMVVIGYRPRLTAIFHAWISLSFMRYSIFIEGGDQLTGILSTLMLPIALTDSRIWHWQKEIKVSKLFNNDYLKLFLLSLYIFIRLQVSIVYLHAATAKFGVTEWINGTAVYYWFNDPAFGLNYWIGRIIHPLLNIPFFVFTLSWGTMALELMLFMGLFVEPKKRKYLLYAGLFFHVCIFIVHGLFTFFFAMAGALILYLRPISDQYDFSWLVKKFK
jgi:antimicrobial peptide system SdpB family protein